MRWKRFFLGKRKMTEALHAIGFGDALIGYTTRMGSDMNGIAIYDNDKCLDILMQRDDMSYEEAVDFFEYNVLGSWVGDKTPIFMVKDYDDC